MNEPLYLVDPCPECGQAIFNMVDPSKRFINPGDVICPACWALKAEDSRLITWTAS